MDKNSLFHTNWSSHSCAHHQNNLPGRYKKSAHKPIINQSINQYIQMWKQWKENHKSTLFYFVWSNVKTFCIHMTTLVSFQTCINLWNTKLLRTLNASHVFTRQWLTHHDSAVMTPRLRSWLRGQGWWVSNHDSASEKVWKKPNLPTHTSPSPENPLWQTQSLLPGRVLLQAAFTLQPPLLCAQASLATHRYTGEKQSLFLWFPDRFSMFLPWQTVPFPLKPAAQRHLNPEVVTTQLWDDMKERRLSVLQWNSHHIL